MISFPLLPSPFSLQTPFLLSFKLMACFSFIPWLVIAINLANYSRLKKSWYWRRTYAYNHHFNKKSIIPSCILNICPYTCKLAEFWFSIRETPLCHRWEPLQQNASNHIAELQSPSQLIHLLHNILKGGMASIIIIINYIWSARSAKCYRFCPGQC